MTTKQLLSNLVSLEEAIDSYEDEDEESGDISNFKEPASAPPSLVDGIVEILLNPNGRDVEGDTTSILDSFDAEYIEELINATSGNLPLLVKKACASKEFQAAAVGLLKSYNYYLKENQY